MATIKYEMTPQERANALAEAKARGVPDGWTVELDVSLQFLYVNWNADFRFLTWNCFSFGIIGFSSRRLVVVVLPSICSTLRCLFVSLQLHTI